MSGWLQIKISNLILSYTITFRENEKDTYFSDAVHSELCHMLYLYNERHQIFHHHQSFRYQISNHVCCVTVESETGGQYRIPFKTRLHCSDHVCITSKLPGQRITWYTRVYNPHNGTIPRVHTTPIHQTTPSQMSRETSSDFCSKTNCICERNCPETELLQRLVLLPLPIYNKKAGKWQSLQTFAGDSFRLINPCT